MARRMGRSDIVAIERERGREMVFCPGRLAGWVWVGS